MVSSRILVFLSAILMLIVHAIGQLAYPQSYDCSNNNGNYTSNSIYETNLNQLLSSLYSNTTIDYGFYYSSYGQNSDTAYAIGLCRGDVTPDDCRGCLKNSSSLLTRLCPNQKEAIAWCDQCMLRYSNSSIFGIMKTHPRYYIWNTKNVSANYVAQFNKELSILLNNLTKEAAAGGSLRKYAAGSAIATDFMRLYALVQCTPDLSEQDCSNCLFAAIADVPTCCAGKVGAYVLLPSCNIRFQVYSFFNSTAAPPSTNTTTSPPSTNTTTSKGIHAIMPITKQIMLSIIRISLCVSL